MLAALFAFAVPTLVGLAKFRRVTSYHTRAAKAVAIVMGAGLLLFLGFDSPWLFQAAVILLLVEAIEEIAITAVLPQWRANVPSIFSALRIARGAAPALALVLLGLPLGAAAGVTAELPDLRPEVSDVHLETNTTAAAGDVAEGCASATKGLDLLKLSLTTQNDGPADMNVGDPMCPLPCSEHPNETCGNPDFICSPAGGHNHPHYNNFLRYEVLDPNGVVAATGGKRSFCLEETACPGQIPRSGHTCENQGLNAGCYDIYPFTLGCQYVDVTAVPDGEYTLRVTVDPLDRFAEVSEANNVIEQPVVIERAPLVDVALEGGAIALKVEKVLKLRTKASEVADLAGSSSDPTLFGAALYVADLGGGSQLGFDLPASGWKRSGKTTAPKGFRYKGDGSDLDPCTSVKVTRKGVKATCRLDGEHAHFDLPAMGELYVRLEMGAAPRRLCASFGGKDKRNDEAVLKRAGAPPASCDLVE